MWNHSTYCLLLFLFTAHLCQAQIQYSEEEASQDDIFDFVDVSDEVFGLQNEVNRMYKLVFAGSQSRVAFQGGLEQKLSPSFSIDMGASLTSQANVVVEDFGLGISSSATGFELFIEPRYYIGMSKGIKSGKRQSNLSGTYIGINGSYLIGGLNQTNNFGTSAKFGVQTSFLDKGLFDVNIFAGVNQFGIDDYSFSMGTQLKIGFGWIANKTEDLGERATKCDVFRCFEENLSWWKLDVLNLPRFTINSFGTFVNPRLKITKEKKFNNTVNNSISHGAYVGYNYAIFSDDFINIEYPDSIPDSFRPKSTDVYAGYEFGIRTYLGKKKKIAKGQSSNNLNGIYIEGVAYAEIGYGKYTNHEFVTSEGLRWSMGSEMHFGLQQRILDRFYVDVFLKYGIVEFDFQAGDSNSQRDQATIAIGYTF